MTDNGAPDPNLIVRSQLAFVSTKIQHIEDRAAKEAILSLALVVKSLADLQGVPHLPNTSPSDG